MSVILELIAVCEQEAPRHPEVNEKNETGVESNNQILAASLDRVDPLALELSLDQARVDRACQTLVEDPNGAEGPAGEDRRQLSPHRLDLGQFRHAT